MSLVHSVRSSYSFMRGYGKPKQFMERAKEVGGTVMAADYCSTWGHVDWQEAGCSALGITLPAVKTLEKDPRHGLVTLIAKNPEGMQDLYGLMGLANEQFYYRPRIKWSQVAESQNVTAIIDEVLSGEVDEATKYARYWFVKPRASLFNTMLADGNAAHIAIPVPASDARFVRPENKETYSIIAQMPNTLGEIEGVATHLLRLSEYERLMLQQGIEVDPTWYNHDLHNFSAKIGKASLLEVEGDLESLVWNSERGLRVKDDAAYRSRVEKELALIREKGFESYFLFVADLVQWAKQRMLVGPGRGSSGGSLVCFLLGITEVDPLVHGTLFERFIDPGRPDLPDIDVDFPDSQRESVFEYLVQKYGVERVARIGTLSEFGGKSALDDVGRVFKVPFNVMRAVKGSIDDLSQTQIHLATAENALKWADPEVWKDYPELEKAVPLEGYPRHTGVHAAGVIVSKEPIQQFGSLKDGVVALDMKMAEKLNLMKMDALGLKTLSVLQDCMKAVGREPDELFALPLDDPKVWEIFNADKVAGVFQFEGAAVRGLMRRVRVTEFNDLCALTSLARPGPLVGGAADAWVKRKAGEESWKSIIPQLESTFGCIVYQEQAMAIVRELAGFDEFDVNGFRRAIGKKDPVKLASYKEQFINGVGVDDFSWTREELEDLWHEMEEFGSYAFNWSHAVAYSMISYYTAYAKAYYPLEYAMAYMKHSAEDAVKNLLREIGSKGVVFFDPERSALNWTIQDGKLVGGFTNVIGIGPKMAAQLLEKRAKGGANWQDTLTPAQRKKLKGPTPYDELHFFTDNYGDVYRDPGAFRINNKVWTVEDLPAEKGDYTFLGRLTKILPREKDGREYALAFFSDDTGEMPCTINKYKWPEFRTADNGKPFFKVGKAYVIRGNIISDRKWLFIEKARELHEPPNKDQADGSGATIASGPGAETDRGAAIRADGDAERRVENSGVAT